MYEDIWCKWCCVGDLSGDDGAKDGRNAGDRVVVVCDDGERCRGGEARSNQGRREYEEATKEKRGAIIFFENLSRGSSEKQPGQAKILCQAKISPGEQKFRSIGKTRPVDQASHT